MLSIVLRGEREDQPPPISRGFVGRERELGQGYRLLGSGERLLSFERLADHHGRAPGTGLQLDELFAAGWPGERASRQAAANRVRVALTTLRKLGLRGYLLTRSDGYLLTRSSQFAANDA